MHQDLTHLTLLRAADDMRRGQPVMVQTADDAWVVLAMERADAPSLAHFDRLVDDSHILITRHRAETLKIGSKGWDSVPLERRSDMAPGDLMALADPTLDLARPLSGPYRRMDMDPGLLGAGAIKLAKVARLLPAVLVGRACGDTADLLVADAESLTAFEVSEARTLTRVADARVPLEGADDCRLIAFRPDAGGLEHIAILIGDPPRSQPVLARLHSECFTGDLLASLKCDCGEQLKGAIAKIREAGGGVILYLAQEGRGIGLMSKLKAYSLQDQGYDTVDANTRLGFDVDERVFAPAAEMVKALGFQSVRLMTNNPYKIDAMERFGVQVSERVEHEFEPNPHNHQYLMVKRDRTGHMLSDLDGKDKT